MNNNPFTEIGAIILAALCVVAGGLLLYVGKVDFTQATIIFGLAVTIYGGNLALKAPSSTQQTQLSNLQQGLQDLINLFATHTHPVPPTPPPSTPTQPVAMPNVPTNTVTAQSAPQVQFVPDPSTPLAAYSTAQMPAVTPQVQP